jgi:hypothetical protein
MLGFYTSSLVDSLLYLIQITQGLTSYLKQLQILFAPQQKGAAIANSGVPSSLLKKLWKYPIVSVLT